MHIYSDKHCTWFCFIYIKRCHNYDNHHPTKLKFSHYHIEQHSFHTLVAQQQRYLCNQSMFSKIEAVVYKIKLRTNLLLIKPMRYVYLHVFSVYICWVMQCSSSFKIIMTFIHLVIWYIIYSPRKRYRYNILLSFCITITKGQRYL